MADSAQSRSCMASGQSQRQQVDPTGSFHHEKENVGAVAAAAPSVGEYLPYESILY